ncbi:hypothetical protein CR513_37054, partial [Mucuna pruriens]
MARCFVGRITVEEFEEGKTTNLPFSKASSISWEEHTYRNKVPLLKRTREQVSNEKLQIENCRTEIQFVDIFNKTLKRERFRCLKDSIGIKMRDLRRAREAGHDPFLSGDL